MTRLECPIGANVLSDLHGLSAGKSSGCIGSITGVHAATRIVAETSRQPARAEVPRPVNLDWSDAVGSTWSRACWHGKRAEVRRVIERVAGANRAPVAFPRRVATG